MVVNGIDNNLGEKKRPVNIWSGLDEISDMK